jgi:hypothetical protein
MLETTAEKAKARALLERAAIHLQHLLRLERQRAIQEQKEARQHLDAVDGLIVEIKLFTAKLYEK